MKIHIDLDLCEGNALCQKFAPRVFQVGDDDKARLLIAAPGPEHRDDVLDAVRACPRGALSLVDDGPGDAADGRLTGGGR